jgi:HAD superfamily hydrolase (TIGR01490 family)
MSDSNRPNLCLFDLDETLLPIDSDHAWGNFVTTLGWVDPVEFRRGNDAFYAQYRAAALDIDAYVAFSTAPLQTRSREVLDAAQRDFMQQVITPLLHPQARALVRSHQARGDLVALVTATNDFVTAPIAAELGIADLIAVRLERDASGTITGRIDGTPSYREGKVVRVGEWLQGRGTDWSAFERISVYSDSINDLPLLERATDPVATNPSPALREVAEQRGWRILKLFD